MRNNFRLTALPHSPSIVISLDLSVLLEFEWNVIFLFGTALHWLEYLLTNYLQYISKDNTCPSACVLSFVSPQGSILAGFLFSTPKLSLCKITHWHEIGLHSCVNLPTHLSVHPAFNRAFTIWALCKLWKPRRLLIFCS